MFIMSVNDKTKPQGIAEENVLTGIKKALIATLCLCLTRGLISTILANDLEGLWFLVTKLNLFYLFGMEISNFCLRIPWICLKVME